MTLTDTPDSPTRDARSTGRDPVLAWSAAGAVAIPLAVLLVPHATLEVERPSASQVTDFFSAHYVMQQAQPLLHSVGGVLLLVFLVRLSTLLGRSGEGAAGTLVRAAGTAVVAMVVTTMALVAAVVTRTGEIDGGMQWELYQLGWDFHFRLLYLLPLVLLPAGWALRRVGAAGLGWFSLGLGVLCTAAPLGYLGEETWFVQYPAFLLFLVWTLVTGLTLGLRGTPRPRR